MTAILAFVCGAVPALLLAWLRSRPVRTDDAALRGFERAHERVVRKDWT